VSLAALVLAAWAATPTEQQIRDAAYWGTEAQA
jgi:hypothetical protein